MWWCHGCGPVLTLPVASALAAVRGRTMGSFSAEGQFFDDWDPRFVPAFGFCCFSLDFFFDTVDIFFVPAGTFTARHMRAEM